MNASVIPPLSNGPFEFSPKHPSTKSNKSRTSSSITSNSFASLFQSNKDKNKDNASNSRDKYSDEELSLFPSCSSGSLQTLTIEDSMKKFKKLQTENTSPRSADFGSKIRVSHSSHNLRTMMLNEVGKDKQHNSQNNSPSLKQTQSQIITDETVNINNSSFNNIPIYGAGSGSRSSGRRRFHVNHFHSTSNLSLYSNNDSENVYDDYSDEVNSNSPHFVESKSVNSLHKKWCMTPDDSRKRRHSHRRSRRSSSSRNCSDEGGCLKSSSSSNLLSHLENERSEMKSPLQSVQDSALIANGNGSSNSVPSPGGVANKEKKSANDDHDYPLSRFVKSDISDDDDDVDDDDL